MEQAAPPPKPAEPKPAAPKAVTTAEEAEKLLENMDQLSDEQVAVLLAVLAADKETT